MVHEFEEEIVPAVNVLPHGGGFEGFVELAESESGLDVPGGATGGADDAGGVFGDEFGIHARPFAKLAFVAGHRGKVEQVVEAFGGFGDHGLVQVGAGGGHVVGFLRFVAPALPLHVESGAGRQVGFDADDGFNSGFGHGAVERVGSEHIAVVGHAHGGHA